MNKHTLCILLATLSILSPARADGPPTLASDGTLVWPTASLYYSKNKPSGLSEQDKQDWRDGIGLGNSATLNVGTVSGTVAAGDDRRITGALQRESVAAQTVTSSLNVVGSMTVSGALTVTGTFSAPGAVSLKGYVVNAFAASLLTATSSADVRSKLGLGGASTLNVGATSGTVAAGNDSRIVNAVQQSGAATLSTLTVGSILKVGGTLGRKISIYEDGSNDFGWWVAPGAVVSTVGSGGAFRWYAGSTASTYAGTLMATLDGSGLSTATVSATTANVSTLNFTATTGKKFNLYNDGVGAFGMWIAPYTYVFSVGDSASYAFYTGATDSTYAGTLVATVNESGITANRGDVVIGQSSGAVRFASNAKITSGSGSPEGADSASVGSLKLRSDGGKGTSLYVKESGSGNTGWIPVVTTTTGDLSMTAGEDLSAKAGYLATVTNSSGAARAVMPSYYSTTAQFVIVSGATAGNTVVLRPLVANVPQTAILSGATAVNPGDMLCMGETAVAADRGTLRKVPTAAGTYWVIAIALESGSAGQTIRVLPVHLSPVTM